MGAVFNSPSVPQAAPPAPPPPPVQAAPAVAAQSMAKIASTGTQAVKGAGALSTATQGSGSVTKGLTKSVDSAPATLLG